MARVLTGAIKTYKIYFIGNECQLQLATIQFSNNTNFTDKIMYTSILNIKAVHKNVKKHNDTILIAFLLFKTA